MDDKQAVQNCLQLVKISQLSEIFPSSEALPALRKSAVSTLENQMKTTQTVLHPACGS